ncbi:hypothetical protein [Psychromicrobium sp. YIM B11713]|uniref:hypothetical protein n=1 Tax=Psychromicrobium sp. YIM B11713 TaxID=3145233 RepID=UPI00374F3FA3
MVLHPKPYFLINGNEIPASLAADNGTVLALRDFGIDWGADKPLDSPSPSRANIRLLDPTGSWTTERDLPGAQLEIGIRWETGNRIIWRGNITNVTMTPRNIGTEAANQQGYFVTISALDRLGSLGNYFTSAAIAYETSDARAVRIRGMIPAGYLSFDTTALGSSTRVKPVSANTSVLDMITQMYESVPRRIYFDAKDNSLRDFDIPTAKYTVGIALWKSPADGKVKAIRPSTINVINTWQYSEAADYESSGVLSRSQDDAVTQVQASSWSSFSNDPQVYVAPVNMPGSANIGSRTYASSSVLELNQEALGNTYRKALEAQGDNWILENATWHVQDGAFLNERHMLAHLKPVGGYWDTYLAGSIHGNLSRYIPLYERIGGTIGYSETGWDLQENFSRMGIDWGALLPKVRTWDTLVDTSNSNTPPTFADFDPSVRCTDLNFVTQPYKNTWSYDTEDPGF